MGVTKRKAKRAGTSYSAYYVQFNVRVQDGTLYLDKHGKRRRWFGGREKREARAQEAIIRTKLLQGWEIEPEQVPVMTLRAYVGDWKPRAQRNLAARTYAGYEQVLDLYIIPALGDRDIKSLAWADVKNLIVEKQRDGYILKREGKGIRKAYSANTLRLIRATLSTVLSEAAEEGIIVTNPLIGQRQRRRGMKPPSVEVSVLSWEQKAAFESKIINMLSEGRLPQSYANILLLMLHTGLRPSEARALKLGDIDFLTKRLHVERAATDDGGIKGTKTGESRWVDLGEQTVERIRNHITWIEAEAIARGKESEWLFPSETGTILDDRHIARAMRKVMGEAGLPSFSPYDLRHTFASLLLSAGVPLLYVAQQLGHAKPTITLKYYARWIPSGDTNHVGVLERTPVRTPRSASVHENVLAAV